MSQGLESTVMERPIKALAELLEGKQANFMYACVNISAFD